MSEKEDRVQEGARCGTLKKGTWKVYVKYNGDARYSALSYKKVTSTKVTK